MILVCLVYIVERTNLVLALAEIEKDFKKCVRRIIA
jgi:hypothetical protein